MSHTPQPALPRVLFVDDEARVLVALKAIFRHDYQVLTANGGAAAIDLMRDQAIDVIVSDQRMPGLTGLDVLRTARELQPRAIRLLLTGYSDLNAIIGSINEGEIFRFVSKPWSNEKLRDTLASAVSAATLEPMAMSQGAADDAATGLARSPVGVLILDEDAGALETLRRALDGDRDAYCARSLDEAIALLERQRIGILLTEQMVGGESVTALLSALRQNHPSLVAIVLTSQIDSAHSIEFINFAQVFRLLRKPVSDSLLRGTVNLASRRFEMLLQNPQHGRRLSAEIPPLAATPEKSPLFARIKRMLLPRW
jgi:DNA-binding NtrC family response regulator